MRHVLIAVVVCALVPLCGCGGSSGSAPAPVALEFTVSQVVPRPTSQEVPLTQEINVVFTRAVDPDSLFKGSFDVIAESGDEIPGIRRVATFNRNVVRFLPEFGYLPFATHTIRVRTSITDESGVPLDREFTFDFRTQGEGPVLPVQNGVEDKGALLATGRYFHRMTLLDSNRFLVTGGYLVDGQPALGTAENLIPGLDQSTILGAMSSGRAGHVQIKLRDGRVLIAGGESSSTPFVPLSTCEIFDPDPQVFRFVPTAPMNEQRSFATATMLADGRVLVTGGQSFSDTGAFIFRADAEIYNPATDEWTLVADRMTVGRSSHAAALTPNGDVTIVGGTTGVPSATLFQTATERFSEQLGTPLQEHRLAAVATLPDGRPFLASGVDTTAIAIWDPRFGFVNGLNTMLSERAFATATPFADGRVLIAGGVDLTAAPPLIHSTVDLFFPIGVTGRVFRTEIRLPVPTTHHAAARAADGSIWITGGLPLDANLPALRQVTVVRPGE